VKNEFGRLEGAENQSVPTYTLRPKMKYGALKCAPFLVEDKRYSVSRFVCNDYADN